MQLCMYRIAEQHCCLKETQTVVKMVDTILLCIPLSVYCAFCFNNHFPLRIE